MAVKPKLCMIPSGVGTDTLYSVLPADGTGDFTFDRNLNTATRINKDGLIEMVDADVPRLNYPLIDGVVSGCPSLLLEPARTNNILYSQEVNNNYWFKSNCIITPNTNISPDGTLNADTLTSSSGNAVLYRTGVTTGSLSFFAKDINLTIGNFVISVDTIGSANWDKNGNLVSVNGGTASNGVDYGNGWFRFTFNVTSGNVVNYGIGSGSGSESILVFGLQNEPNASYSTSYIPTTTSAVTRSAETANNSGDASTFNDSEGVLMAEISALDNDGTDRVITISDGTSLNRITFYYGSLNTLNINVLVGGVVQVFYQKTFNDITEFKKISIKYKENDFSFFVNGFKLFTDISGTVPSGLNTLNFDNGAGGFDFYGNTKQIQYFDTALVDTDLEELTSWTSFNEMANALQYTII